MNASSFRLCFSDNRVKTRKHNSDSLFNSSCLYCYSSISYYMYIAFRFLSSLNSFPATHSKRIECKLNSPFCMVVIFSTRQSFCLVLPNDPLHGERPPPDGTLFLNAETNGQRYSMKNNTVSQQQMQRKFPNFLIGRYQNTVVFHSGTRNFFFFLQRLTRNLIVSAERMNRERKKRIRPTPLFLYANARLNVDFICCFRAPLTRYHYTDFAIFSQQNYCIFSYLF